MPDMLHAPAADRERRALALDALNAATAALADAIRRGASDAELDILLAAHERAAIRAGVLPGGEA